MQVTRALVDYKKVCLSISMPLSVVSVHEYLTIIIKNGSIGDGAGRWGLCVGY